MRLQNDINTSGHDTGEDRPSADDRNRPAQHPYGDAGNLYEIPRTRPDDPPMRRWWTDDESQQDGSNSQNG